MTKRWSLEIRGLYRLSEFQQCSVRPETIIECDHHELHDFGRGRTAIDLLELFC